MEGLVFLVGVLFLLVTILKGGLSCCRFDSCSSRFCISNVSSTSFSMIFSQDCCKNSEFLFFLSSNVSCCFSHSSSYKLSSLTICVASTNSESCVLVSSLSSFWLCMSSGSPCCASLTCSLTSSTSRASNLFCCVTSCSYST